MTAEPPLPLRQVALLLGNIHQLPKNQSDVFGLLRLLKAGELKAGFEFPGTRVFWIPISTSYWTRVSSDKFRALQYKSGDRLKKGTYKVPISDFVDEYIQVVSPEITVSIPAALDELRKALSAARQSFEVAITHEEWTKYLKQHQISDSALRRRPSSGRSEKSSWHHLLPIIAGFLMTEKNPEQLSRDYIAAKVRELANKDGITDLPSVATIRDIISKTFKRASEFRRQ